MDDLHQIALRAFRKYRPPSFHLDEIVIERDAAERRRTGRYTLEEAAVFVQMKAHARAKNILDRMLDAVAARILTIYEPWLNERYLTDIVRPWSDEVYGTDMDDWLEANEPRIGRIFHEAGGVKAHRNIGIAEGTIPGKMPRVSIGLLTINAAWQIEIESKRSASAKAVMDRLQKWADDGTEPSILQSSDMGKRGVNWITVGGMSKLYDIEACKKTLIAWKKSRA